MNWLSILKLLAPYLIGAMIAGGAVWKIQQSRIDSVKADLKIAQKDLSDCQSANAVDVKTIGQLRGEVQKAHSLCEKRLREKEQVITQIQQIDTLGGSNAADGSDSLLDALNRM